MGWKYEVMSWLPINDAIEPESIRDYKWFPIYQGDSLFKAFYYLFRLKLSGNDCVILEWR